MNAPTVAEVQGWTQLDSLKTATPAEAGLAVAYANALYLRFTGYAFADVTADDVPLVQRAVTGLAELYTYQSSPENLEALSDFDMIQSFSAGPYSETRRGLGDAFKARLLVPWPWLSDLLWLLMTDEKRDEWNVHFDPQAVVPAFEVQEVDWTSGADMYDSGYFRGP